MEFYDAPAKSQSGTGTSGLYHKILLATNHAEYTKIIKSSGPFGLRSQVQRDTPIWSPRLSSGRRS
ncbi:MAG: hypothetical protein DME42_02400, partial [Verrucomicrobia bacterium]